MRLVPYALDLHSSDAVPIFGWTATVCLVFSANLAIANIGVLVLHPSKVPDRYRTIPILLEGIPQ